MAYWPTLLLTVTAYILHVGQCIRIDAAVSGSMHPKYHVTHGEITHVPKYNGQLNSKHFGGYVTVDPEHNRNLYYYMVMSERDPASDPVVLWINGGPGCSSFDGFIYEHGPFLYRYTDPSFSNIELVENPYSWSKVATIIYLESPAGMCPDESGSNQTLQL